MTAMRLPALVPCTQCGGRLFSLPNQPDDESTAVCISCGAEFGRWGDLRRKVRAAVAKEFGLGASLLQASSALTDSVAEPAKNIASAHAGMPRESSAASAISSMGLPGGSTANKRRTASRLALRKPSSPHRLLTGPVEFP
jgi:hypothetical protein